MVIDKPAGLPSQPARGGSDSVLGRLGANARLPHRLDAAASGLLLVTLHPAATAAVGRAFQERSLKRTYLAVLDGHVEASTTWERPVGGKSARSHVEPLAHGAGCTAVRLTLDTGRKHQLRIHAALAGHAIVGDRRYGDEVAGRWSRLALHAWGLTLTHPITKDTHRWEAALPDELRPLFESAGHAAHP